MVNLPAGSITFEQGRTVIGGFPIHNPHPSIGGTVGFTLHEPEPIITVFPLPEPKKFVIDGFPLPEPRRLEINGFPLPEPSRTIIDGFSIHPDLGVPVVCIFALVDAGGPVVVYSRNKPQSKGTENSTDIVRDSSGKIIKYTEFDSDGKIVKEVRLAGKNHGTIPRPNVKEPTYNTDPATGQKYFNKYKVRPAKPEEIPKN